MSYFLGQGLSRLGAFVLFLRGRGGAGLGYEVGEFGGSPSGLYLGTSSGILWGNFKFTGEVQGRVWVLSSRVRQTLLKAF